MKTRTIAAATLCIAIAACSKKPLPELPYSYIGEAPVGEVESVIFVVGDAGNAVWEQSPLPRRLAREVDDWARRLGRDSSVAVIFLGDNIYPAGMHEPNEREWPTDSARLESQVMILGGADARRNKAFGVFIAGNHDWGHKFGEGGERRLRNQADFLTRRRTRGIHVRFHPDAGTPGPGIIDVGRHFRMFLIDTAWWLLSADNEEKRRTMARLEQGLLSARGRSTLIAAHHPMRSASAHGGITTFWEGVGVKWLLQKSGAALQDLNSLPYRDLLNQLTAVFRRTGPPLIFAGGHDHALQVMRGLNETEPSYLLVSGAGSKSSKVGHVEGMLYRSLEPGFMQLVIKKNGGVDLFVYSAHKDFLDCEKGGPAFKAQCVEVGLNEFRRRFGLTLK